MIVAASKSGTRAEAAFGNMEGEPHNTILNFVERM
jgi:hypothetical protein